MMRVPDWGRVESSDLVIHTSDSDGLSHDLRTSWQSLFRRAFKLLLLESLILAQDERWRRA